MKIIKLNYLLATLLIDIKKSHRIVEPTLGNPPIVAFTGTRNLRDVVHNINIRPMEWPSHFRQAKVHGGFAIHTRQLIEEPKLQSFLQKYDDFILCGHSLGGAVAVLTAMEVVKKYGKRVTSVHTFGAPRIATSNFLDQYESCGLASVTWRYAFDNDPVSKYTPLYQHVGNLVRLNTNLTKGIEIHDLNNYARTIHEMDGDWTLWP
jgi:triacylglycerol lipase